MIPHIPVPHQDSAPPTNKDAATRPCGNHEMAGISQSLIPEVDAIPDEVFAHHSDDTEGQIRCS
jgi:hypothetical protein